MILTLTALMTGLFFFVLPFVAQAGVFNAQKFTLKNGLEVVVIPNHRAPVVTHMLWYRVGAADELPGLSGMAHYFEHLMFKGTKKLEPGEFSRTVKKLGGNDNAFTGQDYTAYFQSISVEHLGRMMKMEADRMQNLNPPEADFISEKKVVLEERRQRTENDPRGLFTEQMRSSLFVNHPYAIPTIGWMDEIKTYEWEDVKSFYETWYAPNNAVLIVSGDITAKELKPLAQKTYGKIKAKKLPERMRPKVASAIGETKMTLEHKAIHQPYFQRLYLAPASSKFKEDALALYVLEEIVSGGPTARLYKNLVVEQKKAVSVGMSYSGDSLDYGTIWFSATPATGVSVENLEHLVDQEIVKVIKDGVTEDEVKDAIQRLQDQAIYARDSLAGPAMIFGHALTTGSTIDDIENWPEDIARVTAEQVQEVTQKYLSPYNPWIRPPVTGYVFPLDGEEEKKK
ncbi:MAG: insulinase family protein [Alphaproteobacteria bacterium]|nr:insulinase family protein [Alphaproteobacteria bacterium]